MVNVNDIKNGMTIVYDGNIYVVIEFLHVKPGKGPAFVRTKLKNLRTGSTTEHTFNTNVKFEKAIVDKNDMQYLYNSGDTYTFMNMKTYEQIEVRSEGLKDKIKYLKEGIDVTLSFYKGEIIDVVLPDKIKYLVTQTEPGVKGNTATNATKEATLENGLVVKVPLFIEENNTIVISTKDGKYDSRV